jgi:hypothetical protein
VWSDHFSIHRNFFSKRHLNIEVNSAAPNTLRWQGACCLFQLPT